MPWGLKTWRLIGCNVTQMIWLRCRPWDQIWALVAQWKPPNQAWRSLLMVRQAWAWMSSYKLKWLKSSWLKMLNWLMKTQLRSRCAGLLAAQMTLSTKVTLIATVCQANRVRVLHSWAKVAIATTLKYQLTRPSLSTQTWNRSSISIRNSTSRITQERPKWTLRMPVSPIFTHKSMILSRSFTSSLSWCNHRT